jgi:thioredoxin reductase
LQFRQTARQQLAKYRITFRDQSVTAAQSVVDGAEPTLFNIACDGVAPTIVRKLLLATGLRDRLPSIANIEEFYGRSVHHCQYCDAWQHRSQHLAAIGDGPRAVGLAVALRTWSTQVTACLNGMTISAADEDRLIRNGIGCRAERATAIKGVDGQIESLIFAQGPPLHCDCLFFHSEEAQRSPLATSLGCRYEPDQIISTVGKQGTGVRGLFVAGDADGDTQFTIVAAAEGAKAGVAINRELQDDDERLRCGISNMPFQE